MPASQAACLMSAKFDTRTTRGMAVASVTLHIIHCRGVWMALQSGPGFQIDIRCESRVRGVRLAAGFEFALLRLGLNGNVLAHDVVPAELLAQGGGEAGG